MVTTKIAQIIEEFDNEIIMRVRFPSPTGNPHNCGANNENEVRGVGGLGIPSSESCGYRSNPSWPLFRYREQQTEQQKIEYL